MKTRFIFSLLLFLFSLPLHSQIAQRIEMLLEMPAISYQDTALFVLEAADWFGPEAFASPEQAFIFAMEQGWLPSNVAATQAVNFRGFSLLVMRAFEIPGGFLFTLTGSQHHAYRELAYRNIIQGRTDPHMLVSGELLLFTVNRVLFLIENNQL